MDSLLDLIIVGTGPAGYTASIYSSRYKIKYLLIGKQSGGLASEAHKICNYPGFEAIRGFELVQKFKEHLASLGGKEINDEVVDIKKEQELYKVTTKGKKEFSAKAILLATGTKRRKLNLENESRFLGKGVTYCATCDGAFFKDKIVTVVGGSDAANTASLYLSSIAKKVYQIYRKDKLRGDPTWVDQVLKKENIEVIFNANVSKLEGEEKLEAIVLDTGKRVETDGLFIEIGSVPNDTLTKQLGVKTNEDQYIIVDEAQKTNIEGIWAAGDITTASNGFRQVVTACAEGAVAANDIFNYLMKKEK